MNANTTCIYTCKCTPFFTDLLVPYTYIHLQNTHTSSFLLTCLYHRSNIHACSHSKFPLLFLKDAVDTGVQREEEEEGTCCPEYSNNTSPSSQETEGPFTHTHTHTHTHTTHTPCVRMLTHAGCRQDTSNSGPTTKEENKTSN